MHNYFIEGVIGLIMAAFDLYSWVLLPLMIFGARVADVTLGTMRIIAVSKGKRHVAPLLGFVEVIIWLLAMAQVISDVRNVFFYLAYGGGFATGTYVGLLIEDKLAQGKFIVRIITKLDASALIDALHQFGLGTTSLPAAGMDETVIIILCVVNKKDLKDVNTAIQAHNPNAFISVEQLHSASGGVFPQRPRVRRRIRISK